MALLKTCCCFGSLRLGTIVVGVLGIIGSIISIIFIALTKAKMRTIVIDVLDQSTVKIILIINLIMTIIISSLLIAGALKRNCFMMLAWVVLALITIVGMAISCIITTVAQFVNKEPTTGIIVLVFGVVFTCVAVYMWLVVFSFYQQVKEEKGRGAYGRAPYKFQT